MKEKRAKYPFAIFNTDRENKTRNTLVLTFMNTFLIFTQKRILFDSFGFAGFKQFIVDNDKNIIDKMLFNLEKFNKRDTKTNFVL